MNRYQLLANGFAAIVLSFVMSGCEGCSEAPLPEPNADWIESASLDFGRLPHWDPTGGSLVFGDDSPGRVGLWVWDITGAPTRPADNLPPHNWDYRWSPDGRKIAFTSPVALEDSLGGVWMIDVATREKRQLYPEGRDVAWTDSGRSLVFRIDSPRLGVTGLYGLGLSDTTAPYLIADGGMLPQASSRGNLIAFSVGEINAQLFVINLAAASPMPSPVGPTGALQWAWSGNGDYLYMVINRYGSGLNRGVIWKYSANGAGAVDSIVSYAAFPSSDRTGSKLVYAQSSSGRWVGIWFKESGRDDVIVARYGVNPEIDANSNRVALNASEGGIRIYERVR